MNINIFYQLRFYYLFILKMGVCTSDPLGYLIKEYGADVCKYIVAIKAEDYV